ncbi:leucyl aminopeptidase [Candidatus Micrarchaeota archaeon]|nr:leucyl aminopeptidase [Candidatus Micrarchaeota archaeon]MBI5176717.1 leucyl aminopeptidase [Candidatus Micrarchaeota archaeon]
MVKIEIKAEINSCELLVIPVFQAELGKGTAAEADGKIGGLIKGLGGKEFEGKPNQTALLRTTSPLKRVLLYGIGKREEFNADLLRCAGGAAARIASGAQLSSVSLSLPEKVDAFEAANALVQGVLLGGYKFDKYFSEGDAKAKPVGEIVAVAKAEHRKQVEDAIHFATVVSEASNIARDLANESGDDAWPQNMAAKIESIAKRHSLKFRAIDEHEAKKLGMNAYLSVGRGSVHQPKFIVLEYKPVDARGKPIAFVGKGITFDSGGISIKPSANMEKMKHDKSGASAVVGAMVACSQLKIPRHIVGVTPFTENLPSGSATKPGDVVKAMNGKTIEVINTDAEGRLVLSDALAYAVKEIKPEAVIDLATLTGAVFVALGDVRSGLMGNNAKLAQRVKDAGEREFERVWELPMDKEYDEKVKSTVADIKNVGGPMGDSGTIAGAVFLKNFVGDTPWVHLDIAATAWVEKEKPYYCLGATGVGVRLLARMMREWK